MAPEEMHDIVIVGGGITGLALSLGLHRKGVKSLVLEKSESLRSEGAAIGIQGNGWHALNQLGVTAELSKYSIPLTGMHLEYLSKDKKSIQPYRKGLRCLRRKILIEILAKHIPAEQIRFGCNITSLDYDDKKKLHVLTTRDGAVIKAKVLIGCDGLYSVVAKSLQLAPPEFCPVWSTHGLTVYPEGHSFGDYFLRFIDDRANFGRFPVDGESVNFFVHHCFPPEEDLTDPEAIKEFTIQVLKGFPREMEDALDKCDMETLSIKQLGYRPPLALLRENFRRGTMTVAGDAMHAVGPFIGQGASVALEDSVVLTRHLSNAINAEADTSSDETWVKRVEDALDAYAKERRLRIFSTSMHAYLIGSLMYTKSWLVKLMINTILKVFFGGDNLNHTLYECGTI